MFIIIILSYYSFTRVFSSVFSSREWVIRTILLKQLDLTSVAAHLIYTFRPPPIYSQGSSPSAPLPSIFLSFNLPFLQPSSPFNLPLLQPSSPFNLPFLQPSSPFNLPFLQSSSTFIIKTYNSFLTSFLEITNLNFSKIN